MFEPRENEDRNLFTMRWTARIVGAASLLLLLLFLFGSFDWTKMSGGDVIAELIFPVGIMLGLILAWRMEFAGGALTLGSVLTFNLIYGLALEESLTHNWWYVFFAIPGALFAAYGVAASNGDAKSEKEDKKEEDLRKINYGKIYQLTLDKNIYGKDEGECFSRHERYSG